MESTEGAGLQKHGQNIAPDTFILYLAANLMDLRHSSLMLRISGILVGV